MQISFALIPNTLFYADAKYHTDSINILVFYTRTTQETSATLSNVNIFKLTCKMALAANVTNMAKNGPNPRAFLKTSMN